MKINTTMTRDNARDFREEYIEMMAEVERRRAIYREAIEEITNAEDVVVSEMADTLRKLYRVKQRPITAREVYLAMDGKMTYQEVVSILTVAANEHWNGSGRTRKTRFACLKGIKSAKACKQYCRTTTRRFAELDENGYLVPNGRVLEIEKSVCAYTID